MHFISPTWGACIPLSPLVGSFFEAVDSIGEKSLGRTMPSQGKGMRTKTLEGFSGWSRPRSSLSSLLLLAPHPSPLLP